MCYKCIGICVCLYYMLNLRLNLEYIDYLIRVFNLLNYFVVLNIGF